jgi:hypothetical protein
LVPIKWEATLNTSSLKTDRRLIVTCVNKKKIRKRAESAIATFLAMEEDIIPICYIFLKDVMQKYASMR